MFGPKILLNFLGSNNFSFKFRSFLKLFLGGNVFLILNLIPTRTQLIWTQKLFGLLILFITREKRFPLDTVTYFLLQVP